MIYLYAYCEGQTEKSFINRVLSERLVQKGIYVTSIIAATKRTGLRKYGGGTVPYSKMRTEIKRLCADKRCYVTTVFDFYALPSDVPGRKNPVGNSIYEIADYVEGEWRKEIGEENFIPNIKKHYRRGK